MSYSSSNWTGRTPRTVHEAFNPHARTVISEPLKKSRWSAIRIALAVAYILAAIVLYVVTR